MGRNIGFSEKRTSDLLTNRKEGNIPSKSKGGQEKAYGKQRVRTPIYKIFSLAEASLV
jgi:hypothetical protein